MPPFSAASRRDAAGAGAAGHLPRSARSPLEPPAKPSKTASGRHHLWVSLQLRLSHSQCHRWLSLGLVTAALLVLALLIRAQHQQPEAAAFMQTHHQQQLEQHRLLLATHNRLAWYYPLTDTLTVLHEGEGVHYGMFPGDSLPGHPHTVWNVIRPHNWRPTTNAEHLVLLDADTGVELQRVQVPSRFTHDAVRMGDRVYLCSTGNGTILELHYPSMTLLRSMPLFSPQDHPNTLAAAGSNDTDHLWVLLHNLGESDLVQVFVGPGSQPHEVRRITAVGRKAHGLVAWGTNELLMLDSDNGALVSLNPDTGDVFDVWMVPEEGKFLKGLAVLDDVAYFGITTWAERSVRDSPANQGELAAFDLVTNRLLWRRTVATSGLLNIIGAPHLAVDSTYRATYSTSSAADLMRSNTGAPAALNNKQQPAQDGLMVLPDSEGLVQRAVEVLTAAGYPPKPINPADYWASGWPRLDPAPKLTDTPEVAGLQLPLFVADITALRAKVLSLPDEAWGGKEDASRWQALHNVAMTGRTQNMDKFKPGVEGIVLIFSDNDCQNVYEFPVFESLRQELEPLLLEILGPADVHNIVRLQLARMPPGTSDIRTHQDMGGYAMRGHRIHLPLVTHPLVSFAVCPDGDANAASILQGLAEAAAAAAAADTGSRAAAPAAAHGRRLTEAATPSPAADAGGPAAVQLEQQHHHQTRHLAQATSSPPQPPELLPVDVVGGYYTGYAADADADATSADSAAGGQPTHAAPTPALPLQLHQRQRWQRQQPHAPSVAPPAAPAPQNQQQWQLDTAGSSVRGQRPCLKLYTPEGLVFELNNRVPHKVSNPSASGTTRIHLVMDVFESPRVRTPLLPGTQCEYGAMPVNALQGLQQRLERMQADGGQQQQQQLEAVTEEIRALVESPGMTCVGPDGRRVRPLRKARLTQAEASQAEQQEAMVQALLAQLQATVAAAAAQPQDAHTQATSDVLH